MKLQHTGAGVNNSKKAKRARGAKAVAGLVAAPVTGGFSLLATVSAVREQTLANEAPSACPAVRPPPIMKGSR